MNIHDAFLAIALCHNVTPIFESETNQKSFQASSPDEVALVKMAESVNLKLIERKSEFIVIENPLN